MAEPFQIPGLADLRRQIDDVDSQLLELLNRRAGLSVAVGQAKRQVSGKVFDPAREARLLEGLAKRNPGPLKTEHILSIWRAVLSASRSLQKPCAVAYLGPEGTFSYFAAMDFLGESMTFVPCRDFHEIFRGVSLGQFDAGVIPLENSIHGTITQSFDLFSQYEVNIQAEFYSRIANSLLSRETSLDNVKTVYSHAQPLGQCATWLRAHLPGARLVSVDSPAAAAWKASQEAGAASIGHRSMAEKLGMDPFDLRELNCYKEGDTTPTGQKPEVMNLPTMFKALRPKYEAAKAKAKAESTDAVKRGVGLALAVYGAGLDGPDSSEAWAELNPDGSVTIGSSWEDHGQGADSGAQCTAHEALRPIGLPVEKIRLVMNDTSKTPNSGPAGGSRSQVMTGNAIRVACEQLVEAMRKPDGGFYTYDEMKAEGRAVHQDGKWTAPARDCGKNCQGEPFCCYMYGLFMAEVAVEVATGKTKVEKMTMVADIGKVVNRLLTDGQLYGGIAQGIGLALTEDYEDIKKHSTMLGAGIPYPKDIPDNMEIIYVQSKRPDGPFGASGTGEIPLCGPHPAIINAIYNACGARVTHLPAYPEKVLAAMPKK